MSVQKLSTAPVNVLLSKIKSFIAVPKLLLVSGVILGAVISSTTTYSVNAQESSQETSFLKACQNIQNIPASKKKTIQALLTISETEDCQKANSAMSLLTELDLSNSGITDLAPLDGFKNLTKLNLEGNRISDLQPLSKLEQLMDLNLMNNKVAEVSSLSSLKNLQDLRLSGNRIIAIDALSNLGNLTTLYIGENRIVSLKGMAKLSKIEVLGLDNNNFAESQLVHLSGLSELKSLSLEGNNLRTIRSLSGSGMRNLKELSLANNKISDLSPLVGFTSLESLDVEFNKSITNKSLRPLNGLEKLAYIAIRGTGIKEGKCAKNASCYRRLCYS
jgi:internalin A